MKTPPVTRARVRTRLAVGLTLCTVAVAAGVGIAATVLSIWTAEDPGTRAQGGTARVGDDVAVVVVAEDGGEAAADARRDTLEWMLVALAASTIPAIAIGWFAAGRMLGTVDRALAEVEEADAERKRHLQEVVHELRTPLAVASTNLELATRDPDLTDETRGFVVASRRATERMRHTVDDLAGHGRLAVDHERGPIDLATEGRCVAAELSGPARDRGIRLVAGGPATLVVAKADRGAVRTVLGNFTDNAVRLAPSGSTVCVSWGGLGSWAWVSVCDEGPGIPPRSHERVFARGWRGRHDRDRAQGHDEDRGLGLTIARQLAEAHQGTVTVDSAEGTGSTFTLWLPLDTFADRSEISEDGIHPRQRPWAGAEACAADASTATSTRTSTDPSAHGGAGTATGASTDTRAGTATDEASTTVPA